MTRLSVNINKVATLRNARGENIPDVVKFAIDCERFGAQGITVHPRPDERHITRQDVADLRKVVTTEFNIEGYPTDDFMRLVLATVPEQVTLVPDAPDALTSSAGWDVAANAEFLSTILARLRQAGIRSSIFVSADPAQVRRPHESAPTAWNSTPNLTPTTTMPARHRQRLPSRQLPKRPGDSASASMPDMTSTSTTSLSSTAAFRSLTRSASGTPSSPTRSISE